MKELRVGDEVTLSPRPFGSHLIYGTDSEHPVIGGLIGRVVRIGLGQHIVINIKGYGDVDIPLSEIE